VSLEPAKAELLDGILRNEADMAFRRRAPILLDYLELRDGAEVLDCGCGMGFYPMAITRLYDAQVTAVDSDPERLALAQRNGVPGRLVEADALSLPFPDEAFDSVLMSEVLEHIPEDARAVAEAYRVLKPGGVLAVSVPHARYPFWWDPIGATRERLGLRPITSGPLVGIWTNHVRLYRPPELARVLEDGGFALEEIREATHYSLPFAHFLVYGIGKPLLERGLVPRSLERSADRMRGLENPGSRLNVFNAVRALFGAVDRLNDRPRVETKLTFVNVLAKARKPR
jgi:SAM-dependent methyltransferase